jgi:microcystin-dependent protein
MSTPFLGQVSIMSFNFAPRGWAMCNGQLLPINQNQALFSLLGTTYGGNGQTTFALPDLRGRVPVHAGSGISLGQRAGEEAHTLIASEMPAHNHAVQGNTSGPNTGTPALATWTSGAASAYSSASPNVAMNPASIANAGGNQPHPNMPPYSVLNFVIAMQGIFPSRN